MNTLEFRDPNRFGFNAYVNETSVHPATAVLLVAVVVMLFVLRTRYWFILIAGLVCMTGSAQRVVIAGVDFNMLRLIGVVGIGIAILREQFRGFKWNVLDTLVLSSALVNSLMAVLRGDSGVIMMNLGNGVDMVSIYLLGRVSIQGLEDFYVFAKSAAFLVIVIAGVLINEKLTGRNLFYVMGGVKEFTTIRDGALRAQGAFVHPIIAGCWFAASVPLISALLKTSIVNVRGRWLGITGFVLGVFGVLATASMTPLAGLMAGIGTLCIFPLRSYIRPSVQIGFLVAIVLHFSSNLGLHHILYARYSLVSGSTGFFRYQLTDAAINQFGNWWLFGTNGTYGWGWGLDDVTHHFVLAGVRGGALGLGLLIATLIVAFSRAGQLIRSRRPEVRWVGYCIGASFICHVVCFNGVSYFGQILLLYYFSLGLLQTLASRESVLSKSLGVIPRRNERNLRSAARPSAQPI